ncbi:MAG: DUF1289 domain-containing protein [Moraxellaceae bacterium]|nr:DUF1289 domain-containing protein [Pseudomonadales bacterium]MCP5173514.1 DUF1289 domain-containing protein [Moraxellaceae bacterium]MCP5178204.1 DUF1289 domain-containing protein [Moraxellaceae bacterium]
MPSSRPKTPCIGLCSTVFGDSVCRGCMRFVHEVIDWNKYYPEQKQIVWQRLDDHLRVILPQFVKIYDPRKIVAHLQMQRIVYDDKNLWRGIYSLLRLHDKGFIVLEDLGFTVKENYQWTLIQQQLYQLASAHYQKDFARHF